MNPRLNGGKVLHSILHSKGALCSYTIMVHIQLCLNTISHFQTKATHITLQQNLTIMGGIWLSIGGEESMEEVSE